MCKCDCVCLCNIKLFSSHPWDNHKEGIIMPTYVPPLAMFLTTDELCNLFNMLLSSKKKAELDLPNLLIVYVNKSHEKPTMNC